MVNIILFTLNFGDTYTQGGDSSWVPKILPILFGAVIAFLSSILFYKYSGNRKKKENVFYFGALIKNSIKQLEGQIKANAVFLEEQSVNYTVLPINELFVMNDLQRICTKINQEEHYHAYLHAFGNTIEARETFRRVISVCDYFFETTNNIETAFKRNRDLFVKNKQNFYDTYHTMFMDATPLYTEANFKNKEALVELVIIFNHYHDNQSKAIEVGFVYSNLISPISKILNEHSISNEVTKKYIEGLQKINLDYIQLKAQNETFSGETKVITENMKTKLIELKEISAELFGYS